MATDLGKVGIVLKGTWNSSSTYEVLDAVDYNNGLYIAKQAVPANTAPTNTTYWEAALDGTRNYIAYLDCDSCTTIQQIFEILDPLGNKDYLKVTNYGIGNVGSMNTTNLKTLLGSAGIGAYARAIIRPIYIEPGRSRIAEVFACCNSDVQIQSARKYIWMNGSQQSQSAWETINFLT